MKDENSIASLSTALKSRCAGRVCKTIPAQYVNFENDRVAAQIWRIVRS